MYIHNIYIHDHVWLYIRRDSLAHIYITWYLYMFIYIIIIYTHIHVYIKVFYTTYTYVIMRTYRTSESSLWFVAAHKLKYLKAFICISTSTHGNTHNCRHNNVYIHVLRYYNRVQIMLEINSNCVGMYLLKYVRVMFEVCSKHDM